MSRLNSSIAFVILISIYIISLLISAYQAGNLWVSLFFVILSISITVATVKTMSLQSIGAKWNEYPISVLMIVIGALITFNLVKFQMSAVLASSLVGIFGSLILKRYEIEIFTGSFVGMSSVVLFSDIGILVASIIAAVIYLSGKNVFVGIGGKLGSSAFIGTSLVALAVGKNVWNPDISVINTSLPLWFYVVSAILSAFASIMTHQIAQKYLKGSVVLGSSIVGALGYALSFAFGSFGVLFAGTIFAASFAGMSQKKVLKSPLYFAIAGMITAIIFLASSTYFLGLGGKMGTSAFIAVLAVSVLIKDNK
jgi:hypothetical protein